MEGVVAISHLGASTEEAEDNCAMMAAKQIVDFVENGNIINSVNYPRIDLGPKEGKRLVVLHKAEIDANKVLDTVKECNVKVLKYATGTKGAFGATVVEFTHGDEPHACPRETLEKLEGIIRVRRIK